MRKLYTDELKRPSISDIKNYDRFPIFPVLDNIRSMFNVGSAFRTSDATRIQKLFLCGMTAYPPRKEIYKTALGAVDSVPWDYYQYTKKAILDLKTKHNASIFVVEQTDSSIDYKDIQNINFNFPVALVFGNEIIGIQDDVISIADYSISIPMFGIKHSLNISVSFGIVIYEFLYKYLYTKK